MKSASKASKKKDNLPKLIQQYYTDLADLAHQNVMKEYADAATQAGSNTSYYNRSETSPLAKTS